jgi:predicted nucleic acid-binding protein
VITLDTSAVLASLGEEDADYDNVMATLQADSGPYLLPVGVLAEMTFMIERDYPPNVEDAFLQDLEEGRYQVYWHERDLPRIRKLMTRYSDLPLGFSDAVIAVCAEQHGGRVVTLDRRHFDVIAQGERTLTILP